MALIQSYPSYAPVNDGDRWIGTNSTTGSTRNFTAQQIADYLNLRAKIMVGGQMTYQYKNQAAGGLGDMFNVNQTPGIIIPFADVVSFDISTTDKSDEIVTQFFQYLIGSNILLGEGDAISNFGHYKLNTLAQIGATAFYRATVTYLGGNGNLAHDKLYTMIQFDSGDTGDKTEIVTFNNLAVVDVTHTMNKFPSVTVVTTANDIIYGEVQYATTSALTLTFTSAQSGKIYLN
tara:strand:- start:87 stop:785 length:699 start_codon:yes stop_codon:yes gene_type:complete